MVNRHSCSPDCCRPPSGLRKNNASFLGGEVNKGAAFSRVPELSAALQEPFLGKFGKRDRNQKEAIPNIVREDQGLKGPSREKTAGSELAKERSR